MLARIGRLQKALLSLTLFALACFLLARLVYTYLGSAENYPINTIKMVASYEHISHKELETLLSPYLDKGFFTVPVHQLYSSLINLPWTDTVDIERIWPDTLKIVLKEKHPFTTWNQVLLTQDGHLIEDDRAFAEMRDLPHLLSPPQDAKDVLQMYKKMSKILSIYGLKISTLEKRKSHAWEIILSNGVILKLGREAPVERLTRFCKAYPRVFAPKVGQLVSVDLRYPSGMAVKWQH